MIVVVVIISFLLWCLFAGQALIEAYVEMRKVGSGRGQVSAYPRQLESLIRLAEAHARMRLSDVVDVDDVQEARRYPPHTCEMCTELIVTMHLSLLILITCIATACLRSLILLTS